MSTRSNVFMATLKAQATWISPKLTWAALKPVARSAVAAWVSLILIIVPRTERAMGQASFLVLIGSVLSPPNEPLIAIIQREVNILFFVSLMWAWSCLGIKFASLARSEIVYTASTAEIFSGHFIELAPSAVLVLFLGLGAVFIVYMKARLGPGPYIYATIFGSIALDICLTTSALFPYPYYRIGQAVIVPLAIHSAISITCSALIFPETVNAQFIKRLRAVLLPISQAMRCQPELLKKSPLDDDFDVSNFKTYISQAENALLSLRASSDLLRRDVSWGRFSGRDLEELRDYARRLTIRADGVTFFYRIIDPLRDYFPQVSAPSTHPASRMSSSYPTTPVMTVPHTPEVSHADLPAEKHSHSHHHAHFHMPHTSGHHSHSQHHHHRRLHLPSLSIVNEKLNTSHETDVGVFESQHYMNLESRLKDPHGPEHIQAAVKLLSESSTDLLTCCADSLDSILSWLDRINSERLVFHTKPRSPFGHDELAKLEACLAQFKAKDRMRLLKPYVSENGQILADSPPHRYLFQAFVYHFHLMEFAELLISLLRDAYRLEKDRPHRRFWTPEIPWKTVIRLSLFQPPVYDGHGPDDEDPDVVPGVDDEIPYENPRSELAATHHRDPDALPPTNSIELLGSWIFAILAGLGKGNMLFAIKAGVLTAIISLPSFMRSSAEMAYREKWVWALIMSQLTLSRFRGDTAFSFVSRITSTFIGGIIGMVVWYISTGSGAGNSYGLAGSCVVFLPLLMFFRLYYPGPPLTTLLTCVTIALVVGYSWQDTHQPAPSSPGFGFDVAWRRFVLVAIGVTAAFIFSLLPPSTTIRIYHRMGQATTITELGNILCSIISLANVHDKASNPEKMIAKNLISIRSKVKRSKVHAKLASYEFSLRGKWPTARYNAIFDLQLEIAYMLSHMYTVITRLDEVWSKALLHRTRLLDADFLGSLLAVISMSAASLRTGTPMPQITPAPLADRFLVYRLGFEISHPTSESDFGLPRVITPEVLSDEQYLCFSVGVASVYSVITRLDRLMFAVKELVGENFHIDGLEIPLAYLGNKHEE